jgi:hypothetical protein
MGQEAQLLRRQRKYEASNGKVSGAVGKRSVPKLHLVHAGNGTHLYARWVVVAAATHPHARQATSDESSRASSQNRLPHM